LRKGKTEIIQPASKIKPSGIVKNPKIWKDHHLN
jgi:hypothetical protein